MYLLLRLLQQMKISPVKFQVENLIGYLLGWPSLAIALWLAIVGVWLAKPVMLWIALALSAPVALYLSATPLMPGVGVIPIGALLAAALTCDNQRRWPAVLSTSIYAACLVALAYIVISNRV